MKEIIRKYALQNAIKYNGKANPGNLVGKLMQEDPTVKDRMKELMPEINKIVAEVNKMPVEEQKKMLLEIAPELLEKKEKERDIFAFLKLEPGKKVNTGYPPGPEKYPHLGHAKASITNHELARRTGGKFTLRFEDTNPNLVKNEFYDIIIDNLKWLGVSWDVLVYASDHMELFYENAEKLIKDGKAYVCSCPTEIIKESRAKGKACGCRENIPELNMKRWKEMFEAKEGSAILRLKIDLKHKNSTMRDPTIFRIIDEPHARHGKKYRVWPNYDFQNAIMDSVNDIDLRIRSKEFEMRSELQRYVQEMLKLKVTSTYEIGRFNLEGVPSSGRIIRELLNEGKLIGWDDPSLQTLVALRRRGFQPEAIKEFVLSTGLTKSESTLTWDDLIMHNKRLLDKSSNRYFFVENPVEITVEGAPSQEIKMKLHPEDASKGFRMYNVNEKFHLAKADHDNIADGEMIRLMDCLNFKRHGESFRFFSLDHKDFKMSGSGKIIHFLPADENLVGVEILMPDKEVKTGLGCKYLKDLKIGEVIQFERFGFCRLDSVEAGVYKFWFTH